MNLSQKARRCAVLSAGAGIFIFPFWRIAQAQSHSEQSGEAVQKADGKAPDGEIVSRDVPDTFKVRVNLVLVRVVVRDANGHPITDLRKEDFQLADNGKAQVISSFSVESPDSHLRAVTGDATDEGGPVNAVDPPKRFVTLLFDDVHLSTSNAAITRQAATKVLAAMAPSDRFSIFTTSGQVEQDFTADRNKLEEAIQRVVPRPLSQNSQLECPPMTFYEAHMIEDVDDPNTLTVAMQDFGKCSGGAQGAAGNTGQANQTTENIVRAAARRQLNLAEAELQDIYQNLRALIRRMNSLPGQRVVVLISPGFFVLPSMHESGDIIDRATKANIVINTIDARGLWVSSVYDASSPGSTSVLKEGLVQSEETQLGEVLADLANGTGGLFFHDRNDTDEVLRQSVTAPDVSYLLGFTPQDLKLDGKYHHLKVALVNKRELTVRARQGYYAPKGETDPEAIAREEVRQAIFSAEELHGLAIDCHAQFFTNTAGRHVAVVTRLGMKGLKFRKSEDRNNEHVTVSTAIFDENGRLLMGQEKLIDLRLKDSTLERVDKTGLTFKSVFDLQPGSYLVRVVVRDSEAAQIASMNRSVVIP